ncbi:1,4-alpha-glucan branching protein GlgB [Caldalkalibacillus mannanilyticus]|uniref:1,4-alpha-glucan branching protein GlgB n=1 Tax=Caldalkalibacillus mannanilyticus TaxID=1418 RepID=UPI00046816AE|nr:1,4-alpha-glucan branching protein GlgB [Caldalkalibacillus mannanilyticus]
MNQMSPSSHDIFLFHQGTLYESYRMLGAHLIEHEGTKGVRFCVWAPRATEVRVVGNFNHWNGVKHRLIKWEKSGIWYLFVPELEAGELYKYEIHTLAGEVLLKSDPYAFFSEVKPQTASVVYSLTGYEWKDQEWQKNKQQTNHYQKPMLIYEVHLGSWKRNTEKGYLTYRELAEQLVDYVLELGYTHIEILPVMEHPFDGSWGYQGVGYFSVTSRYGSPHDFMYLVDQCHQRGIGVILDWVPSHYCKDAHGLRYFDGTPQYEYEDHRRGENKQWGTMNFDLGKPEVQSFLISNALFWMEVYHIDGLRVDAVSHMIYLNHGKDECERISNQYGGEENLEGVAFIKKLNEVIFRYDPTMLMIAEEATDWPSVTAPIYLDGLGFNYKWNMGWMNDLLRYMELDPIHRKWHHQYLTFSFFYAFSENFILPLSHDEVVHGKKSLLDKMPGDYWQKFANLRVLYGYMMTHPGKKLLFMGGEFGQFIEWKELDELDWHLFEYEMHAKMHHYLSELQHFYRQESSLWELDHTQAGFEWIDPDNHEQSILIFRRKGKRKGDESIVLCNFTPEVREDFRMGVPTLGFYEEAFNSDLLSYGGSGQVNDKALRVSRIPWHQQPYSLTLKIPPLALVILKKRKRKGT